MTARLREPELLPPSCVGSNAALGANCFNKYNTYYIHSTRNLIPSSSLSSIDGTCDRRDPDHATRCFSNLVLPSLSPPSRTHQLPGIRLATSTDRSDTVRLSRRLLTHGVPTVLPGLGSPFAASVPVRMPPLCRVTMTVCIACLPGNLPGKSLRILSGLRGFPVLLVAFAREHPKQATPVPCRISANLCGMRRSSSVSTGWSVRLVMDKLSSIEHQPHASITLRRST